MEGDPAEVIEVEIATSIEGINPADWDACAAPDLAAGGRPANPFLTYGFLSALEASGSACAAAGWAPHHLLARHMGEVVGVMPLYLKDHSQGEYVFDHSWAHAYERAGGRYYPKLQSAVPFTPVTGPRLLVREGVREGASPGREAVRSALLRGAVTVAERGGLSSVHLTFCTEEEAEFGEGLGLLHRTDQQFHWENTGYTSFDDFLGALASRKRKQLRKERAKAVENGITIHWLEGADITSADWEAFWVFYQDTGMRKWGRPYLTRRFFGELHARRPQDILLIMCAREGRWIAGALNLIGSDTLYGRYWGCVEDHACLHFETCYYQAIDFAIARGLSRVEAGAQGGHKIVRGYQPVTTHSLHWFQHQGLHDAVARYLAAEREAVAHEAMELKELTPFRKP